MLWLDRLVLEHHLVRQPIGDVVLLQALERERVAENGSAGFLALRLLWRIGDRWVERVRDWVVGVLVVFEQHRPVEVLANGRVNPLVVFAEHDVEILDEIVFQNGKHLASYRIGVPRHALLPVEL